MGAILSSVYITSTVHFMPDILWHLQLLQWSINPARPTYSLFGCKLGLSHSPQRKKSPKAWDPENEVAKKQVCVFQSVDLVDSCSNVRCVRGIERCPIQLNIVAAARMCKNICRSYRVAVLSSVHKCHRLVYLPRTIPALSFLSGVVLR
jgi:hypothetical protein